MTPAHHMLALLSALCLWNVHAAHFTTPCQTRAADQFRFCDTSLSIDQRVQDLIKRVRTHEKHNLFVNTAAGIPSLNISSHQWWNEALHGVARSPGVTFGMQVPFVTTFPQVIVTSSSYNTTLFNAIATVISTEARAMFNVGQAYLTFWTPNVNVFRDPRWGRGQETPGEDPHLTSAYAEHFVTGFQQQTPSGHMKASACCKHYWGYDVENSEGVNRFQFDAIINEQDAMETYLPPFQACVQKANVSSVMCSYNAVNGVPACADKGKLTQLLREEWKFDGYITSDCGAVKDIVKPHHFVKNPYVAVKNALEAGMDLNCGHFVDRLLPMAVEKGFVSPALVDTRLSYLFRTLFRLGLFDPKEQDPYAKISLSSIRANEHLALSLQAAHQGMVLLKNERKTLPLATERCSNIAVVGPAANDTDIPLGNYMGIPRQVYTPLMGIQRRCSRVAFGAGLNGVTDTNRTRFPEATRVASAADTVVIVVGLDQTVERESIDRTEIALPGAQEDLVLEVAKAAKQHDATVVLVLASGGAVDIDFAKTSKLVDAIVWMGYAGEFAGVALTDILFGNVNPSGRLTQTFYPRNFVHQVSMLDMNMRPNRTRHTPGRGYRFYTGHVVYPFGYGLSYSTFDHQVVGMTAQGFHGPSWAPDAETLSYSITNHQVGESLADTMHASYFLRLRVAIENTGTRAGAQVVLGFLIPPAEVQQKTDMKRKLVAFSRTKELGPGERQELTELSIHLSEFALVDGAGTRQVTPGEWLLQVGDSTPLIRVAIGSGKSEPLAQEE